VEIGLGRLREALWMAGSAEDEEVVARAAELVEAAIGGYSTSIIYGRFRADDLMPREDAQTREPHEGLYLVDETTAVVRFILPVPGRAVPRRATGCPRLRRDCGGAPLAVPEHLRRGPHAHSPERR